MPLGARRRLHVFMLTRPDTGINPMDTVWEQAVSASRRRRNPKITENDELVDDAAGLEPIDEEES